MKCVVAGPQSLRKRETKRKEIWFLKCGWQVLYVAGRGWIWQNNIADGSGPSMCLSQVNHTCHAMLTELCAQTPHRTDDKLAWVRVWSHHCVQHWVVHGMCWIIAFIERVHFCFSFQVQKLACGGIVITWVCWLVTLIVISWKAEIWYSWNLPRKFSKINQGRGHSSWSKLPYWKSSYCVSSAEAVV